MQRRLRLRSPQDFARLRREGRRFQHRCMMLSLVPNGLEHNRYGIVTSKRLGNAVQRNRARRLLREALRLWHPQLRSGYDVVVVAYPPLVGQPFAEVQRIVKELAFKSGLMMLESEVL